MFQSFGNNLDLFFFVYMSMFVIRIFGGHFSRHPHVLTHCQGVLGLQVGGQHLVQCHLTRGYLGEHATRRHPIYYYWQRHMAYMTCTSTMQLFRVFTNSQGVFGGQLLVSLTLQAVKRQYYHPSPPETLQGP